MNAVTPGLIATERTLAEEADVFDETIAEQAVQRREHRGTSRTACGSWRIGALASG